MNRATEAVDDRAVLVRDDTTLQMVSAMERWDAFTLVASLSVDPVDFDELRRGWLRYRPDQPLSELGWQPWQPDRRPPGPWLLIDLSGQRVMATREEDLPEESETYWCDPPSDFDGRRQIAINMPPGWSLEASADWATSLPPVPERAEPLDFRAVLYGEPLARSIARQVRRAARGKRFPRTFPSAGKPGSHRLARRWNRLTVNVHRRWLMTSLPELCGNIPRYYLHAGREWVDSEMENRMEQWGLEGSPPRPLDIDTQTYRLGPMGRQEVVVYFTMCRAVIAEAWRKITATPAVDESQLVEHLMAFQRRWLVDDTSDFLGAPGEQIIELERRRLPMIQDEGPLDCDCPMCRLTADSSMPTFTILDGYHLELDEEFAFSLCETREEWELTRSADRESARAFGEGSTAGMGRVAMSIPPAGNGMLPGEVEPSEDYESPVWRTSFVSDACSGSLLEVIVRMSEIIGALKVCNAPQSLIDGLNEATDAYRAAEGTEPLANSAHSRLAEQLERTAREYPHLTAQAADLQSLMDQRRRNLDG